MRGILLVLALFALAATVTKVTCMTNEEFFNLSKDFATDIEVSDINEDDSGDDVDFDDVITLPGGPDDEVDFDYILMKLGMHEVSDDTTGMEETSTDPWWHRRRHLRRLQKAYSCKCQGHSCKCCLDYTFKVNLYVKKYEFNLHACLEAAYLSNNKGVELTFTLNKKRLYHKEISLKHPPPLCYPVPGTAGRGKVCLTLYNINVATKHFCARLSGVIDIKVYKFEIARMEVGCFNLPMLDADAFQLMLNNPDFRKIKPLDDAPSHDLGSLFRNYRSPKRTSTI